MPGFHMRWLPFLQVMAIMIGAAVPTLAAPALAGTITATYPDPSASRAPGDLILVFEQYYRGPWSYDGPPPRPRRCPYGWSYSWDYGCVAPAAPAYVPPPVVVVRPRRSGPFVEFGYGWRGGNRW